MPVQDTAHERRDQEGAGIGAGSGLDIREQQGEVAVYTLFLQLFSGANAFPGGRNLDQHPAGIHAEVVIQLDQATCAGEGGIGIEGQPGIHFG